MKKFNNDLEKFFREKHIKPDLIFAHPDSIFRSKKSIDLIIYENGQYSQPIHQQISIANLIGTTDNYSKNVLDYLNELYDSSKRNYQARNISFLNSNNTLQEIIASTETASILVQQISPEQYILAGDGKHRCTLLKLYYLLDLIKCTNSNQIEDLKNTYTIPVLASNIDITKTYSKYLLRKLDRFSDLYQEVNANGITGNSVLEIENQSPKVLTDNQLINYIKEKVLSAQAGLLEGKVCNDYAKNKYLKIFIDNAFEGTFFKENLVSLAKLIEFEEK